MEIENGTDVEYDLVTIGAGSGGVRASRVSAGTYGKKVHIILYINPMGLAIRRTSPYRPSIIGS